ncbi:hypothetical protein V9K67_10515 [Paraflavisolibacter sp. H34]|uniref:hypothetical protein n=1 Tax=Huijunlia imazamoxiresistens TaxID=3127457 RepID=UPI003019FC31
MFSKEEIRDLFHKGFQTQAYKAIISEHQATFEKFDFRVAFEKLKEELELPIERNRLYMLYWRKKGKQREKKIPVDVRPSVALAPEKREDKISLVLEKREEKSESKDALAARLEEMENGEMAAKKKKWNF